MKVIVHIGAEKTGTTTIQSLLDRNRGILSEKGFHVLRCAGRLNHRSLPAYCLRASRKDDYLVTNLIEAGDRRRQFRERLYKDFCAEINGLAADVHTVLISSEHFQSVLVHKDELETLRDLLQPFFDEIHILVYLREQADAVLSRFSTAIKSGRTPELSKFIEQCQSRNAFYNYDKMLGKWEQVFGKDHVEAAIFSQNDFLDQDLITDFLSRLSADLIGKMDVQLDIENESLTALGQTIGRAINMAFPAFEDGIGVNPLRTRLMKLNSRHFRGRRDILDTATRASIEKDFTTSNEEVRKRYFPERKTLFSPKTATTPSPTGEADLAVALSEMFKIILADNSVVPKRYVDLFRDVAIQLERDHLDKSYEMMNLAYHMRPGGPLIKAKREEYLARLEELAPGDTPQAKNNGNK